MNDRRQGEYDEPESRPTIITRGEKKRIMRMVELYEGQQATRKTLYTAITTVGAIVVALTAIKTSLGEWWSWIKAGLTGVAK